MGAWCPYEGPGPLEAMANGAVYIQPKYEHPESRLNTKFFANKPTLRELRSQSPYMEEFIGEPYCYTVDPRDNNTLRETLHTIKRMKRLPGKIPKEFTSEGMLERVYVFTEKLDFCNPFAPRWPPLDRLKIFFGAKGQSCKETCMSNGLICERTYFGDISTVALLEKHSKTQCKGVKRVLALHAPSVDARTTMCSLQDHMQAYSCSHKVKNVRRLCPCRNYEAEQTAICRNCL